ncbi:MAG: protein kinase [Polyangiaceae bacterium]|nr:protein kinase [Polyangiaceae bacterium]
MADYELTPGQLVAEYRIEKKIGEGGFGKVYAAVHPVIGKAAAVKILNPDLARSPEIVSRFVDEARAVNQIRHRNIIDIFAFGTLPTGIHYFIMEMLDGMPLDSYVEKHGPLDPAHALSLLWPVGRALVAAHKAGIAHRDLKPENVFLTMDADGAIFPKLLDFGIAKLLHEGEMASRTRTGAMMGTPYYMSPEQCRGVGVDQRSDIYSFGIMTHEVLTGKKPFVADNMMDLLMKQLSEMPPPMSRVRGDLPAALDAPVLHMLQKSAADRPQTMQGALDELAAAARSVGIDLPMGAQASMLPSTPRSSQPQTPQPMQTGPSTTSAPQMDTAAWLARGSGEGTRPPSNPGTTPAPAATAPSHLTPSGHGAPPQVAYPTPSPSYPGHTPSAPSYGGTPVYPSAPSYPTGIPQQPAAKSSSGVAVLVAVVGGLFGIGVLILGLLFIIGISISGTRIRDGAPIAGTAYGRDVSATFNLAFTAPNETQPRTTAELRIRRQSQILVRGAQGQIVTAAEVKYGEASTYTRIGSDPASTLSAPVSNQSYLVTSQGEHVNVVHSDGSAAADHEIDQVLADSDGIFLPSSEAFGRELETGDSVIIDSDDALMLLGLGDSEEGVTVQASGVSLKLVSVDENKATFRMTGTFIQDGGNPRMHLESTLTGDMTIDTRLGLPIHASLTGPINGTLSAPQGTLGISGTLHVESR